MREAEPCVAECCRTRLSLLSAAFTAIKVKMHKRLLFFLFLADEALQPSQTVLNSSGRNGAWELRSTQPAATRPRVAPNPVPQQLPLLAVPARSRSA